MAYNLNTYEDEAVEDVYMARLDLAAVVKSPNICNMLNGEQLEEIGRCCYEEFMQDKRSRAEWEGQYEKAMKLALQVAEQKTFPWVGAANVKFPLLTIAALQFHSRAYPALISGPKPVDCRNMMVYPELKPMPQVQQGQQPSPEQQQQMQQVKQSNDALIAKYTASKTRARRVAEHMSYQILEEDVTWEEEMDKLLLIMSILGCCFKKTYFDPVSGHNISECVSPKDLVVNYWTKSLETSPRFSHIIYLSHNTAIERQRRGIFSEFTDPSTKPVIQFREPGKDEREGVQQVEEDTETPYECIEQYRLLDLDGDGYCEPYIVTLRLDTKQVLRIVARFTSKNIERNEAKEIIRITPIGIFTKYSFIPSPDGGFYDLGFGALLGPINASIDTAINQLLDAGSLSNAGGGFLARGFKAKKGDLKFRLNEWKPVDCTGDDLRKSIFPMPTKEPSGILFNLLTLLIDFGQQVAGAADIMQGKNPGQNTPAETSRAMVEQGMKVFNGIFKRVHRGFTQELRKLFMLNSIFLGETSTYYTPKAGESAKVFGADYSGDVSQIRPAATPHYMSDSQRLQVATAVRTAAHTSPGYNLFEVERRYLEALKETDIDEILPDPKGPNAVPPKTPEKVQIEMMRLQDKEAERKLKDRHFMIELQTEAEKSQAEVMKLRAEAMALMEGVKTEQIAQKLQLLEMQIEAKKSKVDAYMKSIELAIKMKEAQTNAQQPTTTD